MLFHDSLLIQHETASSPLVAEPAAQLDRQADPGPRIENHADGLGPNPDLKQIMKHAKAAIAVLGEPMPLSAEEMTNALAVLNAGGAVLLMSDSPAHRGHAKREIAAMLGTWCGEAGHERRHHGR